MKKITLLVMAVVIILGLSAGCSGANSADSFITLTRYDDGQGFKLGMSRDQVYSIFTNMTNAERDWAFKLKWSDNAFTNCVAVQVTGKYLKSGAGITTDSAKQDVLKAYQRDTGVTVAQNDDSKLLLTKQIAGVNYAIAFRFYSDGTIESFTVYNSDLYTDSDSDYQ